MNHRLSCWFGLSYASWLTLPRILMEDMPDEWQERMAELLEQYSETYPMMPPVGTRVQLTTPSGRLRRGIRWLTNYRYPDRDQIAKLRGA